MELNNFMDMPQNELCTLEYEYTATPVWQDAEIKSSSNFSKSCPKCCQSSLNLKRGVFQNSPKAAVHLGYFWNKYVHPEMINLCCNKTQIVLRFVPPSNVFNFSDNPRNDCFCMADEGCSNFPAGLFNMSACQFGSPVAMSWPHFYQVREHSLTS